MVWCCQPSGHNLNQCWPDQWCHMVTRFQWLSLIRIKITGNLWTAKDRSHSWALLRAIMGIEKQELSRCQLCRRWWHRKLPSSIVTTHDDVISWKHFPRYWPFVRGINRSPVKSPHKGQRRGALIFSFICAWINGWVNNREAGDLRRHRAHYDVIVMLRCHQWWHKQRVLMHEHQGWNVRHGLCHIYMRYVYIYIYIYMSCL